MSRIPSARIKVDEKEHAAIRSSRVIQYSIRTSGFHTGLRSGLSQFLKSHTRPEVQASETPPNEMEKIRHGIDNPGDGIERRNNCQ